MKTRVSDLPPLCPEIRRTSRKTLSLELRDARTLIVHAPLSATDDEIADILRDAAAWIDKNRAVLLERERLRPPEPTLQQREAYVQRAMTLLPERVAHYAARMGVCPTGISVTDARKRFGSCSGKNRLCFSWRLMGYPDAAIDYVVVHELAHIKQKNHSPAFYALIAEALPDYRAREALLTPDATENAGS